MAGKARHVIIVGTDYGTTFSGVNFAWSKYANDSDIIAISEWPTRGPETEFTAKTPTQIAYGDENDGIPKNYWGYQIAPRMVRYAWIKLLLDNNALQSPYDDPDLQRDIKEGIIKFPQNRSAQEVTADYLKELYNFTMERLQRRYMNMLDVTPIKFWFTMPAIWSDEAQVRTLAAAKEAGYGSRKDDEICIITEPEAAAIAIASSDSLGYKDGLKIGEGILLCDCGGGTVDITVYTIVQEDPIQFKELCVGSGGKCGSTYIDRNLHKWMSKRFGDAFDSLPLKKVGQGTNFIKDFEWNKRIFGREGIHLKPLRLFMKKASISDYYNVEREVILTEDDMRSLFDPVVDKIVKLISEQVKDASNSEGPSVSTLMLVGGLGDSPYLQTQLRSWCEPKSITMRVPENSWGVVAKGAVMRGLHLATVIQKKCRYHYGTEYSRAWSVADGESNAYICSFTKRKMTSGFMAWEVEKGETIESGTFKTLDFYTVIDDTTSSVDIDLLSCSLDTAPLRYDHYGVEKVGRITTSLHGVDLQRFVSKFERGRKIYKFDHSLEVVLGDKQGTILFRIRALGEIVGQTSVDFS